MRKCWRFVRKWMKKKRIREFKGKKVSSNTTEKRRMCVTVIQIQKDTQNVYFSLLLTLSRRLASCIICSRVWVSLFTFLNCWWGNRKRNTAEEKRGEKGIRNITCVFWHWYNIYKAILSESYWNIIYRRFAPLSNSIKIKTCTSILISTTNIKCSTNQVNALLNMENKEMRNQLHMNN